mgnify:CR=1 FL=1
MPLSNKAALGAQGGAVGALILVKGMMRPKSIKELHCTPQGQLMWMSS